MTSEEFDDLVREENLQSDHILRAKAAEYASIDDRLSNFKHCAGLRGTNSADALVGMLVKHFESISEMAKHPLEYSDEHWDEKLRDIRNYTYLLRALLNDMRKGY